MLYEFYTQLWVFILSCFNIRTVLVFFLLILPVCIVKMHFLDILLNLVQIQKKIREVFLQKFAKMYLFEKCRCRSKHEDSPENGVFTDTF